MVKEASPGGGEGKVEKASRWLRNINALGALALGGLAILAPPVAAAGLNTLAVIDVAQAGGFEVARRTAKKKRLGKKKS